MGSRIIIATLFVLSSFVLGAQDNRIKLVFTIEYSTGKKVDSIRTHIIKASKAEMYAQPFVNASSHFDYLFRKYIDPKMVSKSKAAVLKDLFIIDGQFNKQQEALIFHKKNIKNE